MAEAKKKAVLKAARLIKFPASLLNSTLTQRSLRNPRPLLESSYDFGEEFDYFVRALLTVGHCHNDSMSGQKILQPFNSLSFGREIDSTILDVIADRSRRCKIVFPVISRPSLQSRSNR